MTIEEIEIICKRLNGVTEDIKWQDHLCFNIGGKMFLVTTPDGVPPTASIKVSDDEFEKLTLREGIIPAPYMAKHKWVWLETIDRFTRREWEFYILEAYKLVASKLSAKAQRTLGLLTETPKAAVKKKTQKKLIAKTAAKKAKKKK